MIFNASDEQLARQAQLGDREAFQTLYRRYLQRVYNRVKCKVPSVDVEDVTQEIFIAVVRSLDKYEQRARFNTWLYTIVNRQIADYYRRRNRASQSPTADWDESNPEDIPTPVDAEQAHQRISLQKALTLVPDHYQEIIIQRFVDGMTFAEIAKHRGQTLEAVKSLYRRAIQAVRDQMGEV